MDIGTGTGIMGVIMGLYGATRVAMSDISNIAAKNSQENLRKFKLENVCSVVQGDLFEKITEKADFIVINQPFFGDKPPENDTIYASMLDSGDLIKRFLKQAPKHLNKKGRIMMPFYSKAGETNNPAIQAPKFGFTVNTVFRVIAKTGIQKGELTIHELYK